MGNKTTILIVEDYVCTRDGLCTHINEHPDMQVVLATGSPDEALQHILQEAPNLLLLDLHLEHSNGWTLLEQLSQMKKLPPTLVLSGSEEKVYASRLLKAGARGYLMKSESMETILSAIQKIVRGGFALSSKMEGALIESGLGKKRCENKSDAWSMLSDRELQVLALFGHDMRAKEIGEALNLSEKTVATYKARIMEKLGLTTPFEWMDAARKAIPSV